jgi:ATP-dependent RNA helicase DHX57
MYVYILTLCLCINLDSQIPQYILETFPDRAKIVVCQPRRLAATGVATRVAEERGEGEPGRESVGYTVRGDSKLSKNSRLVFCTTGVLLRQLQCEDALKAINTIIIDEVHERNLDTDILMGILKQLLPTLPHLRLVLMSATLDADRFALYWGSNTPRMHIPGRTFPVTDFMLEDVLSMTGYIPKRGKKQRQHRAYPDDDVWAEQEQEEQEKEGEAEADDNYKAGNDDTPAHGIPISELVARMDPRSFDYDLLGRLVSHIVGNKPADDDGSILVFMSGVGEINMALDAIKKHTQSLPVQLLPLHGGLQPSEQNLVFRPSKKGQTKVVVSTNVAETSITIPDCTIVIDSAKEKQSSYDPTNRMPLLLEQYCSKASKYESSIVRLCLCVCACVCLCINLCFRVCTVFLHPRLLRQHSLTHGHSFDAHNVTHWRSIC